MPFDPGGNPGQRLRSGWDDRTAAKNLSGRDDAVSRSTDFLESREARENYAAEMVRILRHADMWWILGDARWTMGQQHTRNPASRVATADRIGECGMI